MLGQIRSSRGCGHCTRCNKHYFPADHHRLGLHGRTTPSPRVQEIAALSVLRAPATQATQQLDLYHAQQHLWNLVAELHGRGTPEACAWITPYLTALKNEKDGALKIIINLKELEAQLESYSEKQKEAIRKETTYLENNQHRNRSWNKLFPASLALRS